MDNKKRTKEEQKELYQKVFDYEPTDEEVDALYDDEFDEWLMADELV